MWRRRSSASCSRPRRKLGPNDGPLAADVKQLVLAALGPLGRPPGTEVLIELLGHPLVEVQELGGELLLRRDLRTEPVPPEVLTPPAAVRERLAADPGPAPAREDAGCGVPRERGRHRTAGLQPSPRCPPGHPPVDRSARRAGCGGGGAGGGAARGARCCAAGCPRACRSTSRRCSRASSSTAFQAIPTETVWRLLDSEDATAQGAGRGVPREARRRADGGRGSRREARGPRRAQGARVGLALARGAMCSRCARSWPRRCGCSTRAGMTRGPSPSATSASASLPRTTRWRCSSPWPTACGTDVQTFGREMLARSFRESDGPELLLRLSEHPAPARAALRHALPGALRQRQRGHGGEAGALLHPRC